MTLPPRSLPHLAQLVANDAGWLTQTVRGTHIDLAKSQGYSFEKTETLLDQVRPPRPRGA